MKDNGHAGICRQGTYGGWLFIFLAFSVLSFVEVSTAQSSQLTLTAKSQTSVGKKLTSMADRTTAGNNLTSIADTKTSAGSKLTSIADNKTTELDSQLSIVLSSQDLNLTSASDDNTTDKHSNVVYQVLHSMNLSVDPCDNFFQYTCGNCERSHKPQDGNNLLNNVKQRLKELLEKPYDNATEATYIKTTKDFYQACMDEDRLSQLGGEPVRQLLRTLGMWNSMSNETWPLTSNGSCNVSLDLEAALVNLAYVGVVPFYQIQVNAGAHNNTQEMVWINPGKLGIKPQYLLLGRNSSQVTTYQNWLLVLAVHVLNLTPSSALRQSISDIVDFEIELAKINPGSVKESSASSNNHRYKVLGEMDAMYPKFNWTRYLTLYFQRARVNLTHQMLLAVHDEFVHNLTTIYEQTDERTVASYLLMMVVRSYYNLLSNGIVALDMPMRMVLFGINQTIPRWKTCVDFTNKVMLDAVGSLYVKHYFPPEAKEEAVAFVEFLRDSTQEVILQSGWIDNTTKATALEKAKKLKANVGFPAYLLNDTFLENKYKFAVFDPEAFFENMKKVTILSAVGNAIKLLGPVPDKGKWPVSATDINAYYDSTLNAMYVPAGILQPPFYFRGNQRSTAMSFGALGMVIGHELMHAFDDRGRLFDEDGNKANWWTNASKSNYDQQAQCFVKQFSDIVFAGLHVDGNATLSENIADNGGVKIAFQAFKKWQSQNGNQTELSNLPFTQDQLFFINMAQMWCNVQTHQQDKASVLIEEHSPSDIRAQMVVSNCPEFAQAFHCLSGSRMNPTNKCQLW